MSSKSTSKRQVAVVFLMWLPYGIDYLQRFLKSYQAWPAGEDHKLVIVYNGTSLVADIKMFKDLVADTGVPAVELELAEGQDIDAYFFAANHVGEEFILFLNTYSEFTCSDWLSKYLNAFTTKTSLVGATGSYQSYPDTVFINWKSRRVKRFTFRQFKLITKAILSWKFMFESFPNPHIRTNAFLIYRDEFLSLKRKKLTTKFDAYRFESGKTSLTAQILKNGREVAIVGKSGKRYTIDQWPQSLTFWAGDQEELLITDNQTNFYQASGSETKAYLRKLAWGI